jgi:hypothetical protein
MTFISRSLERKSDRFRAVFLENPLLQRQRMTFTRNAGGPAFDFFAAACSGLTFAFFGHSVVSNALNNLTMRNAKARFLRYYLEQALRVAASAVYYYSNATRSQIYQPLRF